MKVKEVLAAAAELCGRKDLADHLAGKSGERAAEAERECETLLLCYNMTENEIALDYLPLKREENFESGGEIPYAAFSVPPLEILAVYGEAGQRLRFCVSESGVRVRAGKAKVVYSVRPAVKKAGDDAEYDKRGDARLLALGTACEFSLLGGMTDAAALLDGKSRAPLACACRSRGGRLKVRRWV